MPGTRFAACVLFLAMAISYVPELFSRPTQPTEPDRCVIIAFDDANDASGLRPENEHRNTQTVSSENSVVSLSAGRIVQLLSAAEHRIPTAPHISWLNGQSRYIFVRVMRI